jgi:hypothetical protein
VLCVWTYLASEHIFSLKLPNDSKLLEPDKSKRIVPVAAVRREKVFEAPLPEVDRAEPPDLRQTSARSSANPFM